MDEKKITQAFHEKVEELQNLLPESEDKFLFTMLGGDCQDDTITARVAFEGDTITFIKALTDSMEKNHFLAQCFLLAIETAKNNNPNLSQPDKTFRKGLFQTLLTKMKNQWKKTKKQNNS